LNILILFSQPWRVGGAETHVEALIKGLSDHKIILAVNRGSNTEKLQKLRQEFANVEIIEVQARGINVFRWIMDLYKLSSIIKNNKIEIISAQQRTAGIWAYFLNKFTDVPFVVTMHDPWHRAFIKKGYAKMFSQMIVVSKNLTDILVNKFGFKSSQISFINNGIDFAKFVPQDKKEARNRLGISQNSKIILHVSRLSSIKGAVSSILVDSMEHVLQQEKDVKLIIIGEGPLREELNEKSKTWNENHKNLIEIKNFTDDISYWYSAADVIVGEGRVAIEAIACERPVVAIRNGEQFFGAVTRENIADALEVNFDGKQLSATPEALAIEIVKTFKIALEQRIEIAQYISTKLSIEEMSGKYHNVFKDVIASHVITDIVEGTSNQESSKNSN
jgi:glycosyltransferase involved in cell wall biosynthesis